VQFDIKMHGMSNCKIKPISHIYATRTLIAFLKPAEHSMLFFPQMLLWCLFT